MPGWIGWSRRGPARIDRFSKGRWALPILGRILRDRGVISEGPLSADGEVTLTDDSVTADKAFYRVRVTKP